MSNPYLVRGQGMGKRSQSKFMDRVLPNSVNQLDNKAMGISRLLSRDLLSGDAQNCVPIDTNKRSVAISFSNNANQLNDGTRSDPMNTNYRYQRKR